MQKNVLLLSIDLTVHTLQCIIKKYNHLIPICSDLMRPFQRWLQGSFLHNIGGVICVMT